MPGVPSGRGCEACRKQKKKCDQAKPACSRCARLNISCIGAGERRFKFKDQTVVVRSAKHGGKLANKSPVRMDTSPPSNYNSNTFDFSISIIPDNETMRIANAFVSTLQISDLRYSVSYYGAFLKYVPQRLGTNQALDASVKALATASSCLRSREHPTQMLIQYGNALTALRLSLSDPVKAQSPETLCAIYLVMICQGWIGLRDDQVVCHGEVMAQILNAAAHRQGRDSFQDELAFALSIPVIIESMVNPKVKLSPYLLKQAETYGPPRPLVNRKEDDSVGVRLETLTLSSLAKMPDYIRHPEQHLFDMQLTYEQKRIDIDKMRQKLVSVTELPSPDEIGQFTPPLTPKTLIYLYYIAYVLLLALALIINGLLRALDPLDITLLEDSIVFTDEVMMIAESMSKYRPLGAGFVPICLTAAWAATSDPSKQAKIEEMILDYQTDFAGARWMDGAVWLRDRCELLRLKTMAAEMEKERSSMVFGTKTLDGTTTEVDLSRSCCVQ